MTEIDRRRPSSEALIARNTSVVMTLVTLVLIGLVTVQYGQIRELREIDCAASKERKTRLMLYESLILAEQATGAADDQLRTQRIQAFEVQADALEQVIAVVQRTGRCDG